MAPIPSTLTLSRTGKYAYNGTVLSLPYEKILYLSPWADVTHVVISLLQCGESVALKVYGTSGSTPCSIQRPAHDTSIHLEAFQTDFYAVSCKHFTSQPTPVPSAPDHTFQINSSAPRMHLYSGYTVAVTKAWNLLKGQGPIHETPHGAFYS